MKFNEVDDLGLPKFDKKGTRTWYAKEDGLSWLFLHRGLDSDGRRLVSSSEDDKVVLVRGEATRKNFLEEKREFHTLEHINERTQSIDFDRSRTTPLEKLLSRKYN